METVIRQDESGRRRADGAATCRPRPRARKLLNYPSMYDYSEIQLFPFAKVYLVISSKPRFAESHVYPCSSHKECYAINLDPMVSHFRIISLDINLLTAKQKEQLRTDTAKERCILFLNLLGLNSALEALSVGDSFC